MPDKNSLLLMSLVLSMAGCASTESTTKPSAASFVIEAPQYAATYDAAVEVLRNQKFLLDRQDYRFGVVTSKPQFMPTIFEPWHRRRESPSLAWESTFNTQQRIVTIRLLPIASAGGEGPFGAEALDESDVPATRYRLQVQVLIERLQRPLRHPTGATHRGRVLVSYKSTPAEWAEKGITKSYWRPIGRDHRLENLLRIAILQRIKLLSQSNESRVPEQREQPGES